MKRYVLNYYTNFSVRMSINRTLIIKCNHFTVNGNFIGPLSINWNNETSRKFVLKMWNP